MLSKLNIFLYKHEIDAIDSALQASIKRAEDLKCECEKLCLCVCLFGNYFSNRLTNTLRNTEVCSILWQHICSHFCYEIKDNLLQKVIESNNIDSILLDKLKRVYCSPNIPPCADFA